MSERRRTSSPGAILSLLCLYTVGLQRARGDTASCMASVRSFCATHNSTFSAFKSNCASYKCPAIWDIVCDSALEFLWDTSSTHWKGIFRDTSSSNCGTSCYVNTFMRMITANDDVCSTSNCLGSQSGWYDVCIDHESARKDAMTLANEIAGKAAADKTRGGADGEEEDESFDANTYVAGAGFAFMIICVFPLMGFLCAKLVAKYQDKKLAKKAAIKEGFERENEKRKEEAKMKEEEKEEEERRIIRAAERTRKDKLRELGITEPGKYASHRTAGDEFQAVSRKPNPRKKKRLGGTDDDESSSGNVSDEHNAEAAKFASEISGRNDFKPVAELDTRKTALAWVRGLDGQGPDPTRSLKGIAHYAGGTRPPRRGNFLRKDSVGDGLPVVVTVQDDSDDRDDTTDEDTGRASALGFLQGIAGDLHAHGYNGGGVRDNRNGGKPRLLTSL